MNKEIQDLILDIEQSFNVIEDNIKAVFRFTDGLSVNQELFNDTVYFNQEDTYGLVVQLRAFRDMLEEVL
jgi:hypothetical protein